MNLNVTTTSGVVDQRQMTATERFDLACTLRAGWWDCYQIFLDDVVDLRDLGLGAPALEALAADFAAAGYDVHAAAAMHVVRPASTCAHRGPAGRWAPRTHAGRTALAQL